MSTLARPSPFPNRHQIVLRDLTEFCRALSLFHIAVGAPAWSQVGVTAALGHHLCSLSWPCIVYMHWSVTVTICAHYSPQSLYYYILNCFFRKNIKYTFAILVWYLVLNWLILKSADLSRHWYWHDIVQSHKKILLNVMSGHQECTPVFFLRN